MSNRARDNRHFLLKTVFPFLQKMPTKEDLENGKTDYGAAICNLGSYIDHHDARTAAEDIDGEYHCGRVGCLAGWYVMLSDRDKRLGPFERKEIAGYDNTDLAVHFGLESYNQSESLFSALGGGVEDLGATTRGALRERKKRLREIMEEHGDFLALTAAKKRLREYKVFGY
jgi:hypothetical protein